MIKNFRSPLALALLGSSFLFTACNNDDDATPTGPTQNIVQIAAGNVNFTILVEALTATNLATVLEGSGPFTVFAPDNDAFNALFDELAITDANQDGSRVDDLVDAIGVDALSDILLYHVHGAQILAANVPVKDYITTASTAAPGDRPLSLLVEARPTGVILNNSSNVTGADIRATNGVIHRIDAVLLLPEVVDHAVNNVDFSSLVGALTQTNLVVALQQEGPFTVFAPNNQAFANISDIMATLNNDQLASVLTYHVLVGNFQSTDLFAGTFTPINGQNFTVAVGNSVEITDTTGNSSTVIFTNVQGTNGVIHVIDRVLLPEL